MKHLYFLWLLLIPLWVEAQDCTTDQYQTMLREADQAIQKGQYDLAINKLQSAKTCRPEKEAAVNQKITGVYIKINGERVEAIRQKKIAEENAKRAVEQADLAKRSKEEAEIQRDSAEIQRKRAELEKQLAEKSIRSISNTALFQSVRNKNPTLALRVAQYNLRCYADHPNVVSNLYDL